MKNVIAVVGAGLMLGCQTYDFENVTTMTIGQESHSRLVEAHSLKPNIMLLVDNSGSMTEPVAPSGTRISNLQSAMRSFFMTSGSAARFGLTVFPENNVASQTVRVALPPPSTTDVDATLKTNADAVNAAIQALVPNGGTPTNGSLAFVGEEPGLNADDGRLDFVLLLTDGVPNLNLENPNGLCGCKAGGCSQTQINACACTYADSNACLNGGGTTCSDGCLDSDGTVGTIAALHSQKKIDTIVIGFGADLGTGVATDTLNAMALTGAQPRKCNGTTCSPAYYQASDSDELQRVLNEIISIGEKPCEQVFDERPSDSATISVVVEGKTLMPGEQTYIFDGDRTVILKGATCIQAQNSTPQNPLHVTVSAAAKL